MATAQHSKAAEFVRSGIFNNLDSFAELEVRINRIPEEKDRSDVFEIFIEAYLATQPITQRVRHWVVGCIPFEWDSLETAWVEGFAALERFKARERHCRVHRSHIEGSCRV
jgi:hypothetical protein